MAIDKRGVPWGTAGAPLLPESLRRLWSTEPLPQWMAADIGLGDGATFGQLDSCSVRPDQQVPDRVFRALLFLLTSRREEVQFVRCVSRPWPVGLAPNAVPWSTRTRNSLVRGGVLRWDGVDLRKTFGDLLSIDGAGATTALDFAATLESAMEHADRSAKVAVAAIASPNSKRDDGASTIAQILEESWARQVGGGDPRFPELKLIKGSLHDYAQGILESPDIASRAEEIARIVPRLSAVREKVSEIGSEKLEASLARLLGVLRPMEAERHQALSDRLGWSGRKPKTLEDAARPLGLTRERLRQIESKILKRLPKDFLVYAPALDRAIAELRKAAPISAEKAAKLIQQAGISERPFHSEALISAADHLGREHDLAIATVRGKPFVIAKGAEEPVRVVSRLVRQLSGISGAFSVYQLQRESAKADAPFDAERLRHLLPSIPKLYQLDAAGDWWRMSGIPAHRDRLLNLVFKMLSVASPQSVRSLRDGVARVYRWRSSTTPRYRDVLVVPPVNVIAEILKVTREISLDGDMVSLIEPEDFKEYVGESEQILVEVLRSSSTGLLDRPSLARQCIARGMNEATFGILTSYSPLIEHPAPGVWKLRGTKVDPAAVEALRQASKDAPRARRILNYGWTDDGRIWIAARVPEFTASLVVGIPGPLSDYLKGKSFPAAFPDGLPCGTVVAGERNGRGYTLWGLSPFVRMAALEEGDVLKMTFDLKATSAVLEQVDESSLDE